MFKQISGSEAMKQLADKELVYYRSNENNPWVPIEISERWAISDFLYEKSVFVFAIKQSPLIERHSCIIDSKVLFLDTSNFVGMQVRITVEQIG